jgi:hypothetical protein
MAMVRLQNLRKFYLLKTPDIIFKGETTMTAPTNNVFRFGRLQVIHHPGTTPFPEIDAIIFNGLPLAQQIRNGMNSTSVGIGQNHPYSEQIQLAPAYVNLSTHYFNEIFALSRANPTFGLACTDYFFNFSCSLYWKLISRRGSKNLACALLEEICGLVDKWEKKKRKRIHKGTPTTSLPLFIEKWGTLIQLLPRLSKL